MEPGLHALHTEGSKGTQPLMCVASLLLNQSTQLLYSWYALLAHRSVCLPCVPRDTGSSRYGCWMRTPPGYFLTEDSQIKVLRGEECSGTRYLQLVRYCSSVTLGVWVSQLDAG